MPSGRSRCRDVSDLAPAHSSDGPDALVAELKAVRVARRTLLIGVGALGATTLLARCVSSGGGMPSPPGIQTPTPSNVQPTLPDAAVQRAIRDLARTSPDHLSARAAGLVAAKDLTAAVRFVRDNVAVLPPRDPGESAIASVRWGPDATLRAGAGTQRERAELLAALLTAMGASAKVVYCNRPASLDATSLYATRTPAFSVDMTQIALRPDLRSKIEALPKQPAEPDVAPVVNSLLALLPAGSAAVNAPFVGVSTLVPIVEYVTGGVMRWAFALGAIDEVTQAPDGLNSSALERPTYDTVRMRLLAALSGAPGVPLSGGLFELAAGSWTVDQLAGARVYVTTGSSNPIATANLPPADVGVRSGLFTVQQPSVLRVADPALWTPGKVAVAKPAGGLPFTLSGARYEAPASPGGPVMGPYGSLAQSDPATHAAALAAVASLVATADGSAFPNVQLNVSALDAAGAPVFGLSQSDFLVSDETLTQTSTLLGNAAPTVKLMLSYDCSASVKWPSAGAKNSFDTALAGALVASDSSVPFLLGVADVGTRPLAYVTPAADTIGASIAACASSSDVWATLGDIAPASGVSAIVLVSDFQVTDDPASIAGLRQRLALSGLPVALVPVSTAIDQSTVQSIVDACGAVVLDWTAPRFQSQLTTFVSGAAKRASAVGYRSAYRIPDDQQTNQGKRTASVTLAGSGSVSASAPYTVPPAGLRVLTGVSGLYLELRVGTGQAVLRRLSGVGIDSGGTVEKPTQDDYDATLALLNGLTTVAFEPGSPTGGVNADEIATGALTFQPVAEEIGKPLSEAYARGGTVQPYSASLAALLDPLQLPGALSVTAPQALRVAIMTEALEAHGFARRFDVVPQLNTTVVAEKDATTAFAATMRATAPLSFREGVVLGSGAAQALGSAALQYLAPNVSPGALVGFTDADKSAWADVFRQYASWHRFVPTTPAAGAMWVVHPATGTTVAVSRDGRGAGCGKTAANAIIQTALAICATLASIKSLSCNPENQSAAEADICLGAAVGGVAAGVSGILAAALLDTPVFLDFMLVFAGLITAGLPGPSGLVAAVLADIVGAGEIIVGLHENC